MNILGMSKEGLLALNPGDIEHDLSSDEIIHMAKALGAFWAYDYSATKEGMHAILKSGLHSDGFFISRILLAPENIRQIISAQMAMRIQQTLLLTELPDFIVGVPDGATTLGKDIAKSLGIPVLEMKKKDGRIILVSSQAISGKILLIEDFCTRGTGFNEAALAIKSVQSDVLFSFYDPVIINRGGLEYVSVDGIGDFQVLPVVNWRVTDWPADECPLCAKGSIPIKPKATDENWLAITTSQL